MLQHLRPDIPSFSIFNLIAAMLQIQLKASPQLNSRPLNATGVTLPLRKYAAQNHCRNSTDHVSTTANNTSGSDHDMDSTSPCFFEEDEEGCNSCSRPELSDDCGSDTESSGGRRVKPLLGEQVRQMLQGISSSTSRLEQMLHRDVTRAIGLAKEKSGVSIENEGQKRSLRRFVINSLRCAGYNARICKTRWEKTNGYPAGDYEFIDVVAEGKGSMGEGGRLLVDIGFRAQFEIARPTDEYCSLLEVLPTLFIGNGDKLRQMIRIMCEEGKRSLKSKGMHIPPWRKYRYVQAKWLGPYKRTTLAAATSAAPRGRHLPADYVRGTRMGWEGCFTAQGELHPANRKTDLIESEEENPRRPR